jgi:hypothetical protein
MEVKGTYKKFNSHFFTDGVRYNWSPQAISMKHTLDSVILYRHLVIITTVWGNHVPALISLGGASRHDPHPDRPFRTNWWLECGTAAHGFRCSCRAAFLSAVTSFQNVTHFCVLCTISLNTFWVFIGKASASNCVRWVVACLHILDVRGSNLERGQVVPMAILIYFGILLRI